MVRIERNEGADLQRRKRKGAYELLEIVDA